MEKRDCPICHESMPAHCFRKGARACVWCVFTSMRKRAAARFRDKVKLANNRMRISEADFVAWYESQPDCCAYCGLTFVELKQLKIKRGGGYCVSSDIDRVDLRVRTNAGTLHCLVLFVTWPRVTCCRKTRHASLARPCARCGALDLPPCLITCAVAG